MKPLYVRNKRIPKKAAAEYSAAIKVEPRKHDIASLNFPQGKFKDFFIEITNGTNGGIEYEHYFKERR